MTGERKHAILFAATLLCARKLAQADYERPELARLTAVDQAIADAAFILERIDRKWPTQS